MEEIKAAIDKVKMKLELFSEYDDLFECVSI